MTIVLIVMNILAMRDWSVGIISVKEYYKEVHVQYIECWSDFYVINPKARTLTREAAELKFIEVLKNHEFKSWYNSSVIPIFESIGSFSWSEGWKTLDELSRRYNKPIVFNKDNLPVSKELAKLYKEVVYTWGELGWPGISKNT
ncbi:hypothetical protein OZX68_03250 [Streptococcaceae bacterium ESL0729]|nr:hypothetical protein OZX68_03250 [Streptococcaceae bacterium ESL0729]